MKRRELVWLLNLLMMSRALAETTTSSRRLIDLSYHHNLDAQLITSAIPRNGDGGPTEIDVSSCALGDEGALILLNKLLEEGWTDASFVAQTNYISPRGATKLLQSLLNSTEQLEKLDLSYNPLHSEAPGLKAFHSTLEQLLGNATHCPTSLIFDRCGLGPASSRAIGKGLIHRYTHLEQQKQNQKPLSLSLCGNPAMGDAGAAALAAALRFVATSGDNPMFIFERLDLSACDIGDTGAEALALALEASPCCLVKFLDLSNNRITERGAEALSQALATAAASEKAGKKPLLHTLDLSHNPLGDKGAKSIATCLVEKDLVPTLRLRSCHIKADGATALGKALRKCALQGSSTNDRLSLDLSGNPFGVLRGKSKDGDGKYSASRLKSKASATAASYMNQGFSLLKKGLKDVGVDMGPATDESDDEEDDQLSGESTILDGEVDSSRVRCGGRALADAFTNANGDDKPSKLLLDTQPRRLSLGLRHCYFDHAAADALASLKVTGKENMGVDVELDVRLNHVLEDGMLAALHGEDEDQLQEMAETHSDKMSVIREAQERAREISEAAAARAKAEDDFGESWNVPGGLSDTGRDRYDSDDEYDELEDPY